jgi:hypothetical protein
MVYALSTWMTDHRFRFLSPLIWRLGMAISEFKTYFVLFLLCIDWSDCIQGHLKSEYPEPNYSGDFVGCSLPNERHGLMASGLCSRLELIPLP